MFVAGALRPHNDTFVRVRWGGRPRGSPLRTSIGKRCVGADAYIGPVAPIFKPCVGRRALTPPPNTPCTPCKIPCHCEPVTYVTGVAIRNPPSLKVPLPKGGWHGEAVTGGFFPVRIYRKRAAFTPQKSLHQPSVGPPPFRQGRQRVCGGAVRRATAKIAPTQKFILGRHTKKFLLTPGGKSDTLNAIQAMMGVAARSCGRKCPPDGTVMAVECGVFRIQVEPRTMILVRPELRRQFRAFFY